MKILQFNDIAEVQGIIYAKDQNVRFTNDGLADKLISDGVAEETVVESGGVADHEINFGRLPVE